MMSAVAPSKSARMRSWRARGHHRGRQPRQAVEEPHGHTNRGRPCASVGEGTQQERAAEDDERAAQRGGESSAVHVASRRQSRVRPRRGQCSRWRASLWEGAARPSSAARRASTDSSREVSAEIWSSSVVIGGMPTTLRGAGDRDVRPAADSTPQLGRVKRPGRAYTARGWIAARPVLVPTIRTGWLPAAVGYRYVCASRPATPGHTRPDGIKRRTFLDMLLGVGFVSTAVSFVYPLWRYLIPPAAAEAGDQQRRRRQGHGVQERTRAPSSSSARSRPSWCARPTGSSARSWRCAHTSIARCNSRPTRRRSGARATTASTTWAATTSPDRRRARSSRFTVNLRGEPGQEDVVVSKA